MQNGDIKDISQISGLTNNNISDITPLSNLSKIYYLSIGDNQIRDINILKNLTNIKFLYAYGTLIQDITPISSLKGLVQLNLANTQIDDISPLQSNINLALLNIYGIYGTAIIDLSPLKTMKNITTFYYETTKSKTELTDQFFTKNAILKSRVNSIFEKLIKPGMNDIDKELVLHDYIITHTKYDSDGYVNGTVSDEAHMPYGVLVDGVGVCDGYAYSMKALLKMANIESLVAYGDSFNLTSQPLGHAWNIVKIDGEYYHLDLTWDDLGTKDGLNSLYHRYFNVSDKQISANHKYKNDFYPIAKKDSEDFNRHIISDYHALAFTDDAIYSSASNYLYRIDNTTRVAKKLCDDQVSEIAINNSWIYYINNIDGYKIYKIRTDGTERTLVGSDPAVHLFILNNNVFYLDANKGVRKLNKMDFDGKNKTSLNSDSITTTLYYSDNSFFFKAYNNNGASFYRINPDGSGKTQIVTSLSGFKVDSGMISFSYSLTEEVKDGWVYYINSAQRNSLYKIKIDGTGMTKISDDGISSNYFYIIGNWIYYKNSDDSDKFYRIKTDGTQRALVDIN